MFEGLKAFARGWSDKARFPHLSPELSVPYTNAVIAWLENESQRASLRMSIRNADEETLPFDFSYQALPLAMAAAMAHIKSGGDDDYSRFIVSVLRPITEPLGRGKPEVPLSRVIRHEEEVSTLHKVYRASGATLSLSTFRGAPFAWSKLLDVTFPVRSVALMEIMLESTGGRTLEEKIAVLSLKNARLFLMQSTGDPTPQKAALVAQPIAELFFSFHDIPPYKKRA